MAVSASRSIWQVRGNFYGLESMTWHNIVSYWCPSITQVRRKQRLARRSRVNADGARSNINRGSRPLLSNYTSHTFHRRKKEPKLGSKTEYLFGVAPCLAAIQANRRDILEIYFREAGARNTERPEFEMIRTLAKQRQIPIVSKSREKLLKLSEGRPAQNVVMKVSPLQFENLHHSQENDRRDFLETSPTDRHAVWLALDELQDPMNFGAVLRTSAYLGVDRIVVPRDNSAPLSPVVSKASAGAMETTRVARTARFAAFLSEKANQGWDVIGAVHPDFDQKDQVVDCEDFSLTKPTVVILGNEGVGLRSKVQSQCTKFISIFPSHDFKDTHGLESLNVSVAAGILLYSILKGRKRTSQKF